MWEICVSGETGGFVNLVKQVYLVHFVNLVKLVNQVNFCEFGVSGESSCFDVTRRSRSDSVLT